MKTNMVKGFKDIEDSAKRNQIKKIIENIFQLYNFQAVETPIIEYEEFVKSGNEGDEVISDVFKLQDKGKRKLALRYEFTFQLKRLAKNKKLPFRIYQVGPVFRDEPITGNRWRQFTQCDVDIVGSDIRDEAEILKLTSEILNKLGIDFVIYFNNRKLLNEVLDKLKVKKKEEAIREFDKLDKLPKKIVKENLKKYKAEKLLGILNQNPGFFRKYESFSEIEELIDYCELYGVKVSFAPFLARGLSYYNGTIFEIKTSKMRETIAAGGSYKINGVSATGISFGLDRLEMLAKIDPNKKKVLVISLNQDKKAIEVANEIRKLNIPCSVMYGKPGKALEYANSLNIPFVVFIGREEVKKGKVKVRDMKTGKERLVSESQIKKILKNQF